MRNLIRQLEEQSRSGRGMNLNTEMNRLFGSFTDEVMRELASATGASAVPRLAVGWSAANASKGGQMSWVLKHPDWHVSVELDPHSLPIMFEVSGDVPRFKSVAQADSRSVADRILKLMLHQKAGWP